ncbi:L-alanine-DL-glutamate epimerase [Minicystis rosea]|nr:L-alanine-DL-glutamate epimerase [Minicystis rosea]
MTAPTRITRFTVESIDIPMERPFGIAGGAQVVAENALVSIELADGTRGFGEAAPFPAFNGETRAAAVIAAEAARGVVLGEDARAWRRLSAALRGPAGASGSARCAIETAVLDALARRASMPLWAFFGGAERALVTDVTIPTGSIDEARTDATARVAQGFSRLKVKVGGAHANDDLARLLAIHAAAPAAALMLDGNGGLTAEAALDLLAALRARGVPVILFEQPVPGSDLAGLAEVARRGGVPVAADESAESAADVLRIAAMGAAQVVNIKPMKSGVVEALAIAATARAAGLDLMIGGMVEAKIAMSLSACFAAGLGGFAFVDLDTPLFLAEQPFVGGYAQRGEALDLEPIDAGHGARPAS